MSAKHPTDIDRYIAERLRAKRIAAGLSQERLAEAAGITFQQVQKYEKAANRIAASRLVVLARILDCRVTDLLPPRTAAAKRREAASRDPEALPLPPPLFGPMERR